MKVFVKSKWNGLVAFRDKYITEAQEKKENLQILCEGETMTIPYDQVESKIKSQRPVKDKFSEKMQNLVYIWFEKDKVVLTAKEKREKKKKEKIAKIYEKYNSLSEEEKRKFNFHQKI
jgi:hypothetical protein